MSAIARTDRSTARRSIEHPARQHRPLAANAGPKNERAATGRPARRGKPHAHEARSGRHSGAIYAYTLKPPLPRRPARPHTDRGGDRDTDLSLDWLVRAPASRCTCAPPSHTRFQTAMTQNDCEWPPVANPAQSCMSALSPTLVEIGPGEGGRGDDEILGNNIKIKLLGRGAEGGEGGRGSSGGASKILLNCSKKHPRCNV